MNDNDRFGLPLSLVEALRADSSPQASTLADLLAQAEPIAASAPVSAPVSAVRRLALAGLALALGVQSQAAAQPAAASTAGKAEAGRTLEGRWSMAPRSSFQEGVTGAAPDAVVMTVTRDDGERLAYQLAESRRGVEVARGVYDLSFAGAPSTSQVGEVRRAVTAGRDDRGDVVVQAPAVGAYRAVIHLRRTRPDSLTLEHDVEGGGASVTLEQIQLVRTGLASPSAGWSQADATSADREQRYAAR